jgi:hypothetical protein
MTMQFQGTQPLSLKASGPPEKVVVASSHSSFVLYLILCERVHIAGHDGIRTKKLITMATQCTLGLRGLFFEHRGMKVTLLEGLGFWTVE